MPLITRLERKIGWIAIPGVVRVVMCFQFLVFVLLVVQLSESDGGNAPLAELLTLDFGKLMKGEVWRLLSFIFLPPTLHPLGMLIAFLFTVFLGDLLENLWGAFRTTLYVLGSAAGAVLGSALAYFASSVPFEGAPFMFPSSLLFAVAVYHPQLEIRLFFVIPIKIMWLGIFGGALLLLTVVQLLVSPAPLLGLSVLCSIGNFLVVFAPGFRRAMKTRGEVAVRRRRFEAAKGSASEAMHECAGCGKTENDDADLVFRVADNGDEYCDVCRAKNA